jgi:tryptophan synthase alpha chain
MRLRERNEGGLIAYVTAGDPEPSLTPDIVEALVAGGADIIELGIPFSDPIADGPTIQAATLRALRSGMTPEKVLQIVGDIKSRVKVPLVILTYYNPIFKMGLKKFFKSASSSGVDGVIVADLPIEEASDYKEMAEDHEVDTIFLASPSTSDDRLRRILEFTSGFLYLVSLFGVTGARDKIQDLTIGLVRRTARVALAYGIPLAVGFGISKPEHVEALIRSGADAAIVGSGFVKIIEKHRCTERLLSEIETYASKLKEATVHPHHSKSTRE